MIKSSMIALAVVLGSAYAATAAAVPADEPAAAVVSSGTPSLDAPPIFARKGADDPVDHDAGDDRGRNRGGKRGGGADDPKPHASNELPGQMMLARRGADDPAGDDRGGRRGGKGRGGADDPAGHA